MKILSVNAGSSSLKFTLFELPEKKELINGTFEKIGIGNSFYTIKINGQKIKREVDLKDHSIAVKYLMEELISNKIIASLDEIDGIGHRIVQGGALYKETVLVNDKVIDDIENLSDLAPLHNKAHVMGLKAFKEALPNTPMTVVFDTAFHQTMIPEAYLYPVPYEWYEKYKVRKYGFHGTSHRYIYKNISEYLKKDLKVISCHLGNGSSVTAIDKGKVIDTSMGLTPLAGVMMGSRCGDIDPSIIPFIMKKENLSPDEMNNILNKKSGFLGISNISSDARDIIDNASNGNELCSLVLDMNARRVANYIAMYNNLLEGADVICFTAGIGENSRPIRKLVIERIKSLGVKLDNDANENTFGIFNKISTDDSKIPVYVIPTNEELMIAIDTYNLIK